MSNTYDLKYDKTNTRSRKVIEKRKISFLRKINMLKRSKAIEQAE